MRFLSLLFLLPLASIAQTKNDSIGLIQKTASLYDLEYSIAEADSLLDNMKNYIQIIKGMHKTLPANDIPYPFAFNPVPYGITKQRMNQKVSLPIRADVRLPKNKNDLAFYSIPELAGLIKSKQISSVELTKFFIDQRSHNPFHQFHVYN